MMRRQRWSDEELAALRQIAPKDRTALARFRERFDRGAKATTAKLMVLRLRQQARDVAPREKVIRAASPEQRLAAAFGERDFGDEKPGG